jgi:hypothetical protein
MRVIVFALTALTVLGIAGVAVAQIPNAGFESWTGPEPDGWATTNGVGLNSITQSTDRHSGAFAARGEVVSFIGFPISPSLTAGADSAGFPISQAYASLTGFYKFAPLGNDKAFVTTYISRNDTGIAAGSVILDAASSFTPFSIPITYVSVATPTSAWISITIISVDTLIPFPTVGSAFIVDDLAFSGTVSVGEPQITNPSSFTLEQNYPNPFNGETRIAYRVPGTGDGQVVTLKVYDMLGREVATLVNERQPPGEYGVTFDAGRLASGVYLYRLRVGAAVQTRRMMLLR